MSFSAGNFWLQRTISLKPYPRGCHYITDDVKKALPEIQQLKMGVLHLFIQHTSATLIVNESWDASVKTDMEMLLNRMFPESLPYAHSCEGPDDMPAHAKQAFLGGPSLSVPVSDGTLALGTWQGIWLCEHRSSKSSRQIVATLNGCPFDKS
ncbi:unnamed protein product [Dicrocoelium dendriticum]|nr:unnamed protein product [Dicrocoelium dendriticum]